MLPISDYAWTEQKFMQMISTFADVYFKDVSAAALESICYLGLHAWYIKENEIKPARQKGRKKQKQLGQIQTQYAKDLYKTQDHMISFTARERN